MVSNTTPTPLRASLSCVHPQDEGLHRGLLSRFDPSVRSAPLACPRSSCLSRLVLVSFTGLLVIVARHFPSRALMTFSLALHEGCSSHALELCRSVFLLNAAVFVDLALYLAVCGLASVELSCSLTTLVLQARLAPSPRLPILGAFHALFLSQARRLEICNIQPVNCASVCSRSAFTAPGNCAAVCSRSGIGMFWTLLRVIVWVICASHDTCGVAAVCATLISSLNSSSSPREEVSRMSA